MSKVRGIEKIIQAELFEETQTPEYLPAEWWTIAEEWDSQGVAVWEWCTSVCVVIDETA